MLSRARAAAEAGGPIESALQASAEAHILRANSELAVQQWRAASAAWNGLERPLMAAIARWRAAESALAHAGRETAAQDAREALAAARQLRAAWLVEEVEALAARGRLAVGEPAGGAAGAAAANGGRAPRPRTTPSGSTPRERQVLGLVARGATNREIGAELYMAEKTASVHVSRILSKLDVRSRTEAAAVAHRLGLAEP